MNDTHYFNLYTSGLGYLNRIREVTPKKANRSCAATLPHCGRSQQRGAHRFDCRVSGKEAQKLVRRCIDACEQKRKVLIQFRLGDLYADTFVYSKGDHKGETACQPEGPSAANRAYQN